RPDRVTDLVLALVLVLPQFLAGLRVEAEYPLTAREVLDVERVGRVRHALVEYAVGDVHLPACDRRSGVPAADRRPPEDLWPARGDLPDDARLGPDGVAVRAHPLGPVGGRGGGGDQHQAGEKPGGRGRTSHVNSGIGGKARREQAAYGQDTDRPRG